MVKKKFFGSDTGKEKNDTETTENKDNTVNKSGTVRINPRSHQADEVTEEKPSETEAGKEQAPDKTIQEEKVLTGKTGRDAGQVSEAFS